MAANEFEKNVRKEMDEFKLHPSEEVWPKIEERIREKNRKRRVLFFMLFALIALTLGGYGIYNFSGSNTKLEAQHKLSDSHQSNDKDKIDHSKNEGPDKATITIKPNIPAENTEHTTRAATVVKQKPVYQASKEDKLITPTSKVNQVSQDRNAVNGDKAERKQDQTQNVQPKTIDVSSFNQQQIITDTAQKDIAKPGNKNLTLTDTTASKLPEMKDTRTAQVANQKKGNNVSGKIIWGINFSAGASVITEDAFSFKSSYAAADRQNSSPGSVTGGGGNPSTGGGGSGGPTTYSSYSQSQNKPAFAFKVGVHGRKNISKRSSLSVGLGYSYLADKINIGTNQTPAQSFSALWYYAGSPQQTHTDHFHFIELPLIYDWRLTNNADHFLSLNAGVAPSYIVATNALVYDTSLGGIYYHNKDLVTKTHFNFISGISYQFKNKSDLLFSVGPQFSFDVTKVFKSDLDKRKYFLYTGIDARLFFEKKKK